MRRGMALAGVVALLLAADPAHADEPFWNSRPLGYWLNQLRVGSPAEREQAARGVGEMAQAHGAGSVVAAVPLLLPCLDATDAVLRAAAAEALAPLGPSAATATPRLLALFEHDPDPTVRRLAGVAMTRVDPRSSGLVSTAARVLAMDDDPDVRQVAAAALVEAGQAARPALSKVREGLGDQNPIVRVYAAAIVARLGDPDVAVPVLLASLESHDAAVRAESAVLLSDTVPRDQRTVPALIAALGDEERQVRLAAADALGAIGPPAQAAIDPLWRLIHDPDEVVREHSLRALKRIKE